MEKIGCIGQGWIGKNYADNFEERGFDVVRYGLEEQYKDNKEAIAKCDMVFIAVPTPTTSRGSDSSIVEDVISLVGGDKIAVIKSTILPGTTEALQKKYADRIVLHSPEFLSEATARNDVDKPARNIVGIPVNSDAYRNAAERVLGVLPEAPYQIICSSGESEFIKYAGNTSYYVKVVYMNMLYDLAQDLGCDWEKIKEAMSADPMIASTHLSPKHKSGRGAGGHCLIKDFAALTRFYKEHIHDKGDAKLLEAIERKNIGLLKASHKDLDILSSVYGGKDAVSGSK